MGSGRWDADDWKTYTTTTKSYASKGTSGSKGIFSAHRLDPDLDPLKIKNGIRESRDSKDNPKSTPVMVALDVTGSMGMISDAMARTGLNTFATEMYKRRPVTDPHLLFMGIGDADAGDRAPFQATQFEADIRIAKQLEKIFLEGAGGGNSFESYALAYYFAATHTRTDSFELRKKKGYLFTIGDEGPTPSVTRAVAKQIFGDTLEVDLSMAEVLTLATRQWEVFHIMVAEGTHMQHSADTVTKQWSKLLGQRAILLKDHTKLAEVLVSLIQVNEGVDAAKVAGSWDGSTAMVVGKAIAGLSKASSDHGGLVTL